MSFVQILSVVEHFNSFDSNKIYKWDLSFALRRLKTYIKEDRQKKLSNVEESGRYGFKTNKIKEISNTRRKKSLLHL